MSDLSALCLGEPLNYGPGIYPGMSREDYDRIPAFSQSILKRWISCATVPSKFAHWLSTRADQEPSEAQILGSALDTLLLEKTEFVKRFIVLPDEAPKKPTKQQLSAKKPGTSTLEAIAFWKEFTALSKGKRVLTSDQVQIVKRMADRLLESDMTANIFRHCRKTVLIAELEGFPCKCEIDLWNERGAHLPDLKSTKDVRSLSFQRDFRAFGYDKQAAFYLRMARSIGFEKTIFDFVCVENEEPYPIKIHPIAPEVEADHAMIDAAAWQQLRSAMSDLSRRLDSRDWTDPDDYTPLRFAPYFLKEASDILNTEEPATAAV